MTVLYMFIMCLLTSFGQVLVKKGINKRESNGITMRKVAYFMEPNLISGGLLILVAPLLYVKVLRRIGLTNAYGLNGLSYIIIYLMSLLILKEKGSFLQTLGILFITSGVVLWSI